MNPKLLLALALSCGAVLVTEIQGQSVEPPSETTLESQATGLIRKTDGAYEGYTLVAPLRSTTTFLLDMQGAIVHRWKSELPPGNAAYLLEDGSLLRCGRVDNERFSGGGQGGRIQLFSWEGELLWDHQLSDATQLAHHDIQPLPNGNVLAIVWELVEPDELLSKGRRFEAIQEAGLWPDRVIELAPRPTEADLGGAEVVWEWRAWDHLVQDENEQAADFGVVSEQPGRIDVNALLRRSEQTAEELQRAKELEEEMRGLGYLGDTAPAKANEPAADHRPGGGSDWLHTNSIDYLPGEDLILLSSRSMSEIWVLDHGTTTAEAATGKGGRRGHGGDLLWRFGNPKVHGGSEEQALFGQHDARFVVGAEQPRVMVFNNGESRPTEERYSTVEVLELPALDGPADAAPVRMRTIGADPEGVSFYSSFISGAQDLPGGNVLICSGAEARLIEVAPDGTVVWEWLDDLPKEAPARGQRPGGGPGAGPPPQGPDGPRRGPGARGPGGGGGPNGFFRATRYGRGFAGVSRLEEIEPGS